ncbi:MAG TPA: right-handed parallel beta-helix repeat-containing protein [Acidimicrobiales bacterium]|nr:right-handed parallel beta-helix repeat-containing protein [Acidimicrobiales bacterium]
MTAVPAVAMVATGAWVYPAAAAPAQTLACGSVVTHSTTLTGDVGPCAGDGLTIAANNVHLNLNGHKVFGTFSPAGADGIPFAHNASSGVNFAGNNTGNGPAGVRFADVTGSTLGNGEVFNFSVGVLIDHGSSNTVTGIDAHDNVGAGSNDNWGDGISADFSNGNTIRGNVADHNGVYSGISIVDASSNNMVADNQVADNNIAFGNFGIRVEGPNALNNVVQGNTVTGSYNSGIAVLPSCTNIFTSVSLPLQCMANGVPNVANTGTIIRDNVADTNGANGIVLFAMGTSYVYQPTDETITGNTTDNNTGDGISLFGGGCTNNPSPTSPITCAATNNVISHNTSLHNGYLSVQQGNSPGNGITLGSGANNNTVDHNTVDNNAGDGIQLQIGDIYGGPPDYPVIGTIPGSGASNNVLVHNVGLGNKVFDGEDQTPGCDNNIWSHNVLQTVNQPCVLGSGPRAGSVPPGQMSKATNQSNGMAFARHGHI